MSEAAEEIQHEEGQQKPNSSILSIEDQNPHLREPIDFRQKKAEKEARDREEIEKKKKELEAEQQRQVEQAEKHKEEVPHEQAHTNAEAHVSAFHNRVPVTAPERTKNAAISWDAIENSLKSYESDLQARRDLPEGEKGRISQATYERDLRRKRGDMYQRMIDQRVDGVKKHFGVDDLNALKVGNFPDLLQHAGKNEVFRNVLIKEIQHRAGEVHEDPMKAAEFTLQQVKKIYGSATSETPSDGQVTKSWAERRVRGLRREMAMGILSNEQNLPTVNEYIKSAEAYVKAEKARGNKNITEWPGGNLELAFHLRRILAEQDRKAKKARTAVDQKVDDAYSVDKSKEHTTRVTGMMDALGRYGSATTGEDISGDDLRREAGISTGESDAAITAKKDDEDDDDGVPVPLPTPILGEEKTEDTGKISRRGLLKGVVGIGAGVAIDAVISPGSAGGPGIEQVPDAPFLPNGNPDSNANPDTANLPRRPENPIHDTPPGGGEGNPDISLPDAELKEEVEKWDIGAIKVDESGSSISQEMLDKGYIQSLREFKDNYYLDDPQQMAAFLLIDFNDYLKSWHKAGNSDSFTPEDIMEWAEKGGGDKLKQIFDTVQLGQHYYVPLSGKTGNEIYNYFKKIKPEDLSKTVGAIQPVLKARVEEMREEKKHHEGSQVEDIIKTFAPTEAQPKKKGGGGFLSRWFGGKK